MPSIAINGLGRIGRAALKILLDTDGLDVVAVNDIADADNLAAVAGHADRPTLIIRRSAVAA
jgi:glyceraldehyde-3-phosphate dehydrogenase/erythrose-4-phosphate dehydrogenase